MTVPAWRRWLPLVALLTVAAGVYVSGLHHHLSMATLHEERVALERFVADHPVIAPMVFMAVYAAATALSLPGALILTLAGGFLFGVVLGGLWSVLGATAGAVMVFQIARSAFGASWRQRAGPWLQRMEAGFREDAFAYLLVLRLVPLFPFWLVNLVPAFLGVSLRTFTLASVLGMIPGVGKQLQGVDLDDRQLEWVKAIVLSMTPQERAHPEIIKGARRARIAKGSGTSVQQVNQLLNGRKQMEKMMRQMGRGKNPNLQSLVAQQMRR